MKLVLIFLLFMALLPIVSAQSAKEYTVLYTISGDSASVKTEIALASSISGFIDVPVPASYSGLRVLIDGVEEDYTEITRNSSRLVDFKILPANKNIIIEYESDEFVSKTDLNLFIASTPVVFNSEKVRIKAVLPEHAVLAKKDGQMSSTVVPKAYVSTDGNQIILSWSYDNVPADSTYQTLVIYKLPPSSALYVLIYIMVAALFVCVILIFLVIMSKRPKTVKDTEVVKEENVVTLGLKEKEEQVVNVLKLKGGQTTQSTLRVATDMPKATLSGIVKELVERRILHKEKKGNKNVITLKDPFLNDPEQKKDDKPN